MIRLLLLLMIGGAVALYLGLGGEMDLSRFVPEFLRPLPSLQEVRTMSAGERADAFDRLQSRVDEDPTADPGAYLDYLVKKEIVSNKKDATEYMVLMSGGKLGDVIDDAFSGIADLFGGGGKPSEK